ncbi:type II toxin-antitoxin system HicA family toxin [Candidatus Binatus sp.]|jgi:predicted RNA binding protein YcfA (HicA-like mRNA interferase family)|uniref:type II toxin-antitoxin system HicA family toxin n=1 Tax=Candidatus Binatus sp. TaxID=2811406 RepID=UPI003BCB6675
MRLPALKAREVIRVLEQLGFQLHHSTGSHRIYKNPATGRRAVIPFHGSRDLNVNVLRSILRQADLAEDEFVKLL